MEQSDADILSREYLPQEVRRCGDVRDPFGQHG